MAREYARIKVGIWADPDFRRLSVDAQHLYFLLLTSPNLNLIGAADWRPNRIAAMAEGWTARKVRSAGAELEASRFIVVDEETEEVVIRSFVRHDGVLKGPKTGTALANDFAALSSPTLMLAVSREVARAASEDPSLKGLVSVESVIRFASDTQSDTQSTEYPASIPIPQPSALSQQNPALNHRRGDGYAFEAFWDLYPRKVSKGHAVKAWGAATKRTEPPVIIEGLRRQLPALGKLESRFIPHPATWLNGERWADQPATSGAERTAWDRVEHLNPRPGGAA